MSLQADEYRRLAEIAKANAESKDDEICRDVLMRVSDAYALMARVQEDFDQATIKRASMRYSEPLPEISGTEQAPAWPVEAPLV